jgi:hypothetical protein
VSRDDSSDRLTVAVKLVAMFVVVVAVTIIALALVFLELSHRARRSKRAAVVEPYIPVLGNTLAVSREQPRFLHYVVQQAAFVFKLTG